MKINLPKHQHELAEIYACHFGCHYSVEAVRTDESVVVSFNRLDGKDELIDIIVCHARLGPAIENIMYLLEQWLVSIDQQPIQFITGAPLRLD